MAGEHALRCPTTGLRCYSPATLPTGNAGRNRHEPASKVSAPADIQGGDAVSDGKPFGRSDAVSVRTMPWRLGVLLAAIGTILFPVASLAQPTVPDVPKEIAVPPGHKLLFKVEGKGVQIYKAVEGKSGTPEWVLEAPLADLFECKGGKAGCHYDNPPSWEAADGSKVVKSGDAKSAPAPNSKEDIPWLLVKVKAEDGKAGTFSPAVYIQRLQTEGGKAPAELPKRVGTKVGVAYKAVYYFYGKAE